MLVTKSDKELSQINVQLVKHMRRRDTLHDSLEDTGVKVWFRIYIVDTWTMR